MKCRNAFIFFGCDEKGKYVYGKTESNRKVVVVESGRRVVGMVSWQGYVQSSRRKQGDKRQVVSWNESIK